MMTEAAEICFANNPENQIVKKISVTVDRSKFEEYEFSKVEEHLNEIKKGLEIEKHWIKLVPLDGIMQLEGCYCAIQAAKKKLEKMNEEMIQKRSERTKKQDYANEQSEADKAQSGNGLTDMQSLDDKELLNSLEGPKEMRRHVSFDEDVFSYLDINGDIDAIRKRFSCVNLNEYKTHTGFKIELVAKIDNGGDIESVEKRLQCFANDVAVEKFYTAESVSLDWLLDICKSLAKSGEPMIVRDQERASVKAVGQKQNVAEFKEQIEKAIQQYKLKELNGKENRKVNDEVELKRVERTGTNIGFKQEMVSKTTDKYESLTVANEDKSVSQKSCEQMFPSKQDPSAVGAMGLDNEQYKDVDNSRHKLQSDQSNKKTKAEEGSGIGSTSYTKHSDSAFDKSCHKDAEDKCEPDRSIEHNMGSHSARTNDSYATNMTESKLSDFQECSQTKPRENKVNQSSQTLQFHMNRDVFKYISTQHTKDVRKVGELCSRLTYNESESAIEYELQKQENKYDVEDILRHLQSSIFVEQLIVPPAIDFHAVTSFVSDSNTKDVLILQEDKEKALKLVGPIVEVLGTKEWIETMMKENVESEKQRSMTSTGDYREHECDRSNGHPVGTPGGGISGAFALNTADRNQPKFQQCPQTQPAHHIVADKKDVCQSKPKHRFRASKDLLMYISYGRMHTEDIRKLWELCSRLSYNEKDSVIVYELYTEQSKYNVDEILKHLYIHTHVEELKVHPNVDFHTFASLVEESNAKDVLIIQEVESKTLKVVGPISQVLSTKQWIIKIMTENADTEKQRSMSSDHRGSSDRFMKHNLPNQQPSLSSASVGSKNVSPSPSYGMKSFIVKSDCAESFEFESSRVRNKVTVRIYRKDIVNVTTDAVVSPINEFLDAYGGVAKAISTAAGPDIAKELSSKRTGFSYPEPGSVFSTSSGRLYPSVKHLLHVVTIDRSRYSPKDPNTSTILYKIFLNCLCQSNKAYHDTSICIPAIGLKQYGAELVTKAFFEAIQVYNAMADSTGDNYLHTRQVHLVERNPGSVKQIISTIRTLV